jgi:isopenicillin-N epimerase
MKSQFLLNPDIVYLNHGSFGACPRAVFADYQKWQLELENEPVQFITKNALKYLRESKEAVGKYINCDPQDFFFTSNPTAAVNTIMRSLNLIPGDEILTTDHEYGAMDRTWNFYCKKSGAVYRRQQISLPILSKEQMISEFWKGYNNNTKVIFINQISSATALIFPVKEICEKAKELGLITIVDGAHVPGHIDLDLKDLDVDFYTGTMHKWMLTPKGNAFLYVRREIQATLDPLIVSWGYDSDSPGLSLFLDYHEQQGTRDISAFLTAPAAIAFLQTNDWNVKAEACRKMILDHYGRFCDLLRTKPICPITEEFLGQMCSIQIKTEDPAKLKELLFDKYNIEIPIMKIGDRIFMRISIQAYNTTEDLDRLYAAIEEIIESTDLFHFE